MTASAATSAALLLDTEIYSGDTKIAQNFVPLNLYSTTTFNSIWNLAAQANGTYTIKVGVFQNDWSKIYNWNNNAGSFTVSNGDSPPPAYTDSITFNHASYNRGSSAIIKVQATANINTPNVLVDVEIYDSANHRINQHVVQTNLTANAPFTNVWNTSVPNIAGQYKVKIGIFSNDWSHLYQWDDNAGSFQVKAAPRGRRPLPRLAR